MPKVSVEWDEPGAGSICLDGSPVIWFNLPTDWEDGWNPDVHAEGLAFLDRLPRWAQEVDHAYWCARSYERLAASLSGASDAVEKSIDVSAHTPLLDQFEADIAGLADDVFVSDITAGKLRRLIAEARAAEEWMRSVGET
jgi:hypothetical protein